MKNYQKKSMQAVLLLSLISIPTVALAGEGVAINDFPVEDGKGNIVKSVKTNETIQLNTATEKQFGVDVNGRTFSVPKENILQTVRHEESSLSVINATSALRSTPDLFGNAFLALKEGETLHRIENVKAKNGFIKVRTNQSLEGWVLKSSIKQNIKNIPVQTKAFIDEDTEEAQSLFYGDAVTLTGFANNQFTVKLNDREFFVNRESVSFQTPPIRYTYKNPVLNYPTAMLITSMPGHRVDPVYGVHAYHGGVDVAVPKNTPIHAIADGTVIKTHSGETYNNRAGYGNFVKLSHKEGVTSVSAHLTSFVVKEGEQVKQGQLIGYSGRTGKSTGYHLHLEIKQDDILMDSSAIVKGEGVIGDLQPAPR